MPSATAAKLLTPVTGERDRRVREVELRRLELRLRLLDRRRGGLLILALRVVQVLLRQRVLLRRAAWCGRDWTSPPASAAWFRCKRRFRRVDLRLERLLVHLEQHLARLDDGAFDIDALVEEAGNARLDVHRLRALRLRDVRRRRRACRAARP